MVEHTLSIYLYIYTYLVEHTLCIYIYISFGRKWNWDEGEELMWLCGLNAESYWRLSELRMYLFMYLSRIWQLERVFTQVLHFSHADDIHRFAQCSPCINAMKSGTEQHIWYLTYKY